MIALEDFFRKPERAGVQISPDGKHLSFLAPHDRRLNLWVRDLETGEERRLTNETGRDLAGYLWVDDEHLVYVRDEGGDENYRLYSVRFDGENARDLTPFEDVQCDLVDDLEDVPGQFLFQMNKRDSEKFDVYRMDVRDGSMTLAAENPGTVSSWITDNAGKLRLGLATDGVTRSLLYRETEEAEWSTIASYSFRETVSPLQFTFDDAGLYVASNLGRDRTAIYEFDLERGVPTRLLFEHDEVDVGVVLSSRRRKCLTGVTFETDRVGFHFFDEERARIQTRLDEALPGFDNRVISSSRDETRYIISSRSDRSRGRYYLYDTSTDSLDFLFSLSPWLDDVELAPMVPIVYEARDGSRIHGYLTKPLSADSETPPLIVNPHGGPWHRDSWGFNPEVQFLASRGYAVLQMNFRGSTGYGRRFWESSFGEWGGAMQDDVSDGVRWAIENKMADPERVAIYGASYGGYASLAGLVKTPELYRCGVSYVGVSNLFTFLDAFPPYWKQYLEMVYEMVGHPEEDADRLRATSPFFHAEKIVAPLFVAQGANDPRVKQAESDQIVEALRERGVEVKYLVKENEGHGFHNEENQFEFYRELDSFLSNHLKG